MAWFVLVAALAAAAVGVVVRGDHTESAGVAPAAETSGPPSPADVSGRRPGAVSLPGSVALSSIPAPLPGESATGGADDGRLTIVDPPPGSHPVRATAPPGPDGLPGVPLAAYRHAEQVLGLAQPGCRLHWPLLAAIGRAESGNAQGGNVDVSGHTIGRILGPRLDGSPGLSRVPDTDRGELDGDPTVDRAVGPMQLLPSTWRRYAADGDGDGRMQPDDVFDAALTAGRYLCAGGADLDDADQLGTAVFRYRHSADYVSAVRGWAADYARGAAQVPLLAPVPRAPEVLPAPDSSGDRTVAAPPVVAAPPDIAPARPPAARPAPRHPAAAEAAARVPARRPEPAVRAPSHPGTGPARPAPDLHPGASNGPAPAADVAPTSLMPVVRSTADSRATTPPDALPTGEQAGGLDPAGTWGPPSAQVPPVQAPPAEALPAQVPPVQAPSAQGPSPVQGYGYPARTQPSGQAEPSAPSGYPAESRLPALAPVPARDGYPAPAQGGYPAQAQGGYPVPAQGGYSDSVPGRSGYPVPAEGGPPVPAQGGYAPPAEIPAPDQYPVQPQGRYPAQGQARGAYPPRGQVPAAGRYPLQGQAPTQDRYQGGQAQAPAGTADPGYVYIIPENRAANAGMLPANGGTPPAGPAR